jgi:Integrase core domain
VRLRPLSGAAVAQLARRAGRAATGLRALTGGNPLLVTEVLAAGDAGVPMTIRDLVLARLAGLPANAQEVVRLVAVVPTRAELWLLEQALEAKVLVEDWRIEYNTVRPHSALGYRTPTECARAWTNHRVWSPRSCLSARLEISEPPWMDDESIGERVELNRAEWPRRET